MMSNDKSSQNQAGMTSPKPEEYVYAGHGMSPLFLDSNQLTSRKRRQKDWLTLLSQSIRLGWHILGRCHRRRRMFKTMLPTRAEILTPLLLTGVLVGVMMGVLTYVDVWHIAVRIRHFLEIYGGVLGTIATILLLACISIAVLLLVWLVPRWQVSRVPDLSAEKRFNYVQEARKTVIQGLTGVVVVVGLYMPMRTLDLAGRQSKAASDQVELSRRGQVYQRFDDAISRLKDGDLSAIGAATTLGLISDEFDALRWPAVDVLAGYIRENAPLATNASSALQSDRRLRRAAVQAAVTALCRRSAKHSLEQWMQFYEADLSRCDLIGMSFNLGWLEASTLAGSRLSQASFRFATLSSANLSDANLDQSDLTGADLSYADLTGATLRHAVLDYDHLEGKTEAKRRVFLDLFHGNGLSPDLVEYDAEELLWDRKSTLFHARLVGANLSGASLKNANLREAQLTGTDFSDAVLKGADFTKSAGLEQGALRGAICDSSTKLPPGLSCVPKR